MRTFIFFLTGWLLTGSALLAQVKMTQQLKPAEDRSLLVVVPYSGAVYKASDYQQLQSAISEYRSRYGFVVQGYDASKGGYVIASPSTRLNALAPAELEGMKSSIVQSFPTSVFTIKTQFVQPHLPKEGKQPSAKPKEIKR